MFSKKDKLQLSVLLGGIFLIVISSFFVNYLNKISPMIFPVIFFGGILCIPFSLYVLGKKTETTDEIDYEDDDEDC